nr:MAG: ORF1 [TTV-like mini virus]
MPRLYRRKYYRNFWKRKPNYSRRWIRNRRPRSTFRSKRRRRRVRRKNFKFYKHKLKKIRLYQWQPSHIKKCRIKGTIQLFQAGRGRFSHNYQLYKESFVPPHQPGGGGWSYILLSLGNLFTENQRLQNWWTKSNKGLPLCRYQGVKFKFYRQKYVDYIVTYSNEYPMEVGKYHYPSVHPQRMLTYNHRIIVPSLETLPLMKKSYKSCFIRPPKEMKDQWYFQNNFQRYPLVMLAVTACSLQNMYVAENVLNNNCTINALNTNLFKRKSFQFPNVTTGYYPKTGVYLYASPNGGDKVETIKISDLTYLGNTGPHTEGEELNNTDHNQYVKAKWGNVFHEAFMNEQRKVIISSNQLSYWFQTGTSTKPKTGNIPTGQAQFYTEPLYYQCRYNPSKDTGEGNEAYWVNNLTEEQGWDTQNDEDLVIRGFPLWILLWGWYDWTKKLNKIKNIDNDYVLVVKTNFIEPKLPWYIFLNDSFPVGLAPYNQPINTLPLTELNHWYPRYKFQIEAIETLLMTGTGVCRAEAVSQIQAHCYYKFFFKWGGNPSTFESVIDPTTQPFYPTPGTLLQTNEIVDPNTSPLNLLYDFDIRRHLIKQTALQRIQNLTDFTNSMFTDGTIPTIQEEAQAPQETDTQEEAEKKKILQQLNQYKQLNITLLNRYRMLQQYINNQ